MVWYGGARLGPVGYGMVRPDEVGSVMAWQCWVWSGHCPVRSAKVRYGLVRSVLVGSWCGLVRFSKAQCGRVGCGQLWLGRVCCGLLRFGAVSCGRVGSVGAG